MIICTTRWSRCNSTQRLRLSNACDQSDRCFVFIIVIVVAAAACVIVLHSDIFLPSFYHIQVLRPIAMTTKELYVKVLFTNSSSGEDIWYAPSRKMACLFWCKIARWGYSHRFNFPRKIEAAFQRDVSVQCVV